MNEALDDLAARLDAVAEELTELILRQGREWLDSGAEGQPPDDRQLTRARRAVEKAADALRREIG